MSSSATRGQIVNDALSLAGRSTELKQACNAWLNYSLRDIGLTFRFPELRKTGSTLTLLTGTNTVSLPTDLGAGMEKSGMIFGPDLKPLNEVNFEEFANTRGYPFPNTTGRPQSYTVDKEAGVFRFNLTADQNYSITPVYFKNPPEVPVDFAYDNTTLWIDNDIIAVHSLIWWIYVFLNDERENAQEARVMRLLTKWEKNTVKLGGTSRVLPSPSRFKSRNSMGFGGFFGP